MGHLIIVSILIPFISFLSSCKKDPPEQVIKVTYEVVMVEGVKTVINYNSDYYINTGTRKDIIYNSGNDDKFNGRYWTGQHYAKKSEGYYIKVDYTKLQNIDSTKYKVAVYVNDTLLVSDFDKANVLLQGNF